MPPAFAAKYNARGSGEPAEALWFAVAASKGNSCKNCCMLWHPPTGTMRVLNSASPLCSNGGDAVTDAERYRAREALTLREKEARAGVLGCRRKKRGDEEEAAERLLVSTRKVAKPTAVAAAVAAALAAPDVARLNECVDRLKEAFDTWREMAQSRKGVPAQLTAGASQESSQSSPPSAPSTPGPVTPQRCSPRKHGHK